MKTLLLALLLFASCAKEEDTPTCKTCDINVKYWTATNGNQFYIESSTKYCNDEWISVDGHIDIRQGTNSGVAWKKTSTTNCHD